MLVLVTGAGGQTGTIIVRKLLQRGDSFTVRAMVRSEDSEARLRRALGNELARNLLVVIGDVTEKSSMEAAFKGAEAVIVATSAMPRLCKASLIGVLLTKFFSLGMSSRKPSFYFDDGQTPEKVDWEGQRDQFDLAKEQNTKHVVLISSMGGTQPDHFTNKHFDNCVLWKRKAECYLMTSGLPYTIIHPGGLLPHYGARINAPGGRRQLHAALDDALLDDERKLSLLPREDLAEVCVQCLLNPGVAAGRAFDLGSGPETQEERAVDLTELLEPLKGGNCQYTEADAEFQPEGSYYKDRSCTWGNSGG